MKPIGWVVLGVVIAIVMTIRWHHNIAKKADSEPSEVEVTFDTLTYNNYVPSFITRFEDPDSLPIYHFCDSIDGTWSADVAGHDVELRSLVLRERIESRIAAPSWEVMMQGGFSGSTSWVGVGVERNLGRVKLSVGAGYDPFNRAPHLEGRVGVVLWRE